MLTIYKASAGSGKTYTLAYQYIKLLLCYYDPMDRAIGIFDDVEGPTFGKDDKGNVHNGTNDDDQESKGRWCLYGPEGPRSRHRRILAVTFTHKATEEMKNRIIKELKQIVATADAPEKERSDYSNKIMELTGCTPEQLKDTAQKALDDLLYDFHFFNVSTIDSFFQQVLRGFAREVAKNEDFALEIDNNVAVTMGVDSMLNSINTDSNKQTEALAKFLQEWMSEEYREGRIGNMFNRNTHIYKNLVSFVASTMNEEFKEHSEAVIDYLKNDPSRFERFRKALFERYKQIPEEAQRLAVEAVNLLANADPIVQANINTYAKGSLCNLAGPPYATKPFDWNKTDWTRENPGYVCNALTDPIKLFKKKYTDKFSEAPQPLCDTIARTFEAVIEGVKERKWLKAIISLLSHFGVLVSALEFIMQYRQDNNLILLSDTNELLQKVIDDNDAPFIYEKLGNRLEYFLIDEFQDTSRLQWENLRPLVRNSISEGNENLIIGDEKQSIYRFRNADAELLHVRAQEDVGQGNYLVRGDNPGENTNYRSAPAVVRFNNALFSYLGNAMENMYFKNVIQDIPAKNRKKRGHVRFDVIRAANKTDYGDLILKRLLGDIRSLKQRGYKNGDIVILVRTRDEGSSIVEYLLQHNDEDIVVASDESLKLTMCPSVRVILSSLRMFAQSSQEGEEDEGQDSKKSRYSDPEIRMNEVEFINSTESNISDAVVKVVAKRTDELKRLDDVVAYRSSNLFTLTERIIQDILSPEMRRKDYSYIMAFQDYVSRFCAQYTSNVRKFLRWWDINESNLTVSAAPNAEAIRVMTIHKSKGLEFKCVLMPFTNVGVKSDEELWLSGDRLKGVKSLKIQESDIPPLLRVEGSSSLNDPDCPFYEDYVQWRKNQKTDMLNVGYVAFTRAEHELIGYVHVKSLDKATTAVDPTADVLNIGELLINSFLNVDSLADIDTADPATASADGSDGNQEGVTVPETETSAEDEIFYCRERQARIPLTMPLSPYYGPIEFESEDAYQSEFDSTPKNASESITLEDGLQGIEPGLGTEGEENEPEPFTVYRFEYGKPTSEPAVELTEEEKELQQQLDAQKQKEKEKNSNDVYRSPLEKISISEYTPTFPKNVEHYFTVEEEEDTYEEVDLSSEAGDSPSEEESLPGGYSHQAWGEILHRVMSYIRDKGDTERAIARVTRQFHMDGDSYNYLSQRIWKAVELDDSRVKRWFDGRLHDSVVTERPIYEPTTLATYRPDRIIWYKDGSVDIVDYKFGAHDSQGYDFQMKKYIELIQYMGVEKVRGFLYFPSTPLVKEIFK